MMGPIRLQGIGDAAAVVPHVLGVHPDSSLVIFPDDPHRRPFARIDLPDTIEDCAATMHALARAYATRGDGPVMVLAFTDRLDLASAACEAVAEAMPATQPVAAQLAVDGDHWLRLDEPTFGTISQADRDRIAAEYVLAGRRQPYTSPAQLRASFDPRGPDLTDAVLTHAHHAITAARGGPGLAAEKAWLAEVVTDAVTTGAMPGDEPAARMIGDVQLVPLRDHVWALMDRSDAGGHAALWKNLLTRSPQEAIDPVVSLAAFGAWLAGEGMAARLALERLNNPDYSMAQLVSVAVEHGLSPANWARGQAPQPEVGAEQVDPPRRGIRRDPPTPPSRRPQHGPQP